MQILAVFGGFARLHQPHIPCNGIAFRKGILGREKGRKQGVTSVRSIFQELSCSFARVGDQGQAQRGPVDLKECAWRSSTEQSGTMPGPDKIAEMQKIFQNSREYTHLQVRWVGT